MFVSIQSVIGATWTNAWDDNWLANIATSVCFMIAIYNPKPCFTLNGITLWWLPLIAIINQLIVFQRSCLP